MKFSNRFIYISLFVFFSLVFRQSALFASDQLQTVRATGVAVGAGTTAEERAILDAQRKAVIEAAGVFIDAQSLVNNYELIDDQILSHARGYLTQFKKIKCWTEPGLTHCEIRATVGVENLERDWRAALPQLIHRQSEPRCMVIFTEDADTTDLVGPKLGGSCAHRMESLLKKNGFRLVDKRTIDQIMDKDTQAAYLNGDAQQLIAKAQQFDAELLIYGSAEADPLGAYPMNGKNVYRWEMALNARIVRLDTADVIVSDSYALKKPFVDFSPRCGNKGFRKLADKVAPKLLRDLSAQWQQRFQHRILEVQFHGCSPKNFTQKVYPALSRMPGVRAYNGIITRSTSPEEVITEIHWAGNLDSLINAVYRAKISDGVEFEEQFRSGNRIRFDVTGLD